MIPDLGKERRATGSTGEPDANKRPSPRGAFDWQSGLDSVVQGVRGMQSALVTGDVATGIAFADAVVAMTTALLDELDLHPCSDPEWDAELISTLRVYRNGAFVFRNLPTIDARLDRDTEAVCMAILEQGHDHLRALVGQSSPTKPGGSSRPEITDSCGEPLEATRSMRTTPRVNPP